MLTKEIIASRRNKYFAVEYSLKYNKGNVSKPWLVQIYARTFMEAVNRVIKAHTNHTTEHVIINSVVWH